MKPSKTRNEVFQAVSLTRMRESRLSFMEMKPTYEELEARLHSLEKEISQVKRSEKVLQGSEDRFRRLFEQSNDAIIIHKLGRIIDANPKACQVLGYDKSVMMTMTVGDLYPDEDRREARKRIGFVQSGEPICFKTEFVKSDGSFISVEVTSSIVDVNEAIVLGIIREVTRQKKDRKELEERVEERTIELSRVTEELRAEILKRKQVEGALRYSEKRFREVAGLLPTVICEIDLKLNVTYVNNIGLEIFGYTQTELEAGINAEKLVHPEFKEKMYERIQRILQGADLGNTDYRFLKKDGSEILALVQACPREDNGSIIGLRLSITDITERKRLELQLQQAQKMEAIGTLAGGIAHNFNNLLMGVQGYASLMLADTDSHHPHYQRLQNIEKLVVSGSKLTGQLLGYAREGNYAVVPISLNQLVKDIAHTFGETNKEIRIHQQLADDLFGIKADQGQIEQVLLNLFINAAEAMPEGGNLYLKTMNVTNKDIKGKPYKVTAGNYVLLRVKDTGSGMDKETIKRIFEPFFSKKGPFGGTGLGLASAYGIIKAHTGYIDVSSEIGQGTTFEVYLPATMEEILAKKVSEKELKNGKETLLLVDDEDVIIDVGQDILRTLGYNVLTARSGEKAIEIYQEKHDDIAMVILDMVMPEMGGGEVFDMMKKIRPEVLVLLSSGYSIHGRAKEILNRGCAGFIQKPFNMKDLSMKIREVLDKI